MNCANCGHEESKHTWGWRRACSVLDCECAAFRALSIFFKLFKLWQ